MGLMADKGPNAEELWEQGNQFYKDGRFPEAVERYEALAILSPGGWVYYNLGNAYLKSGNLGRAVLSYSRASKCLPRSKEVRGNLSMALDMAKVSQDRPLSVSSAFRDGLSWLTGQEWLLVFSLFYGIAFVLGVTERIFRIRGLRSVALTSLAVSILVLCLLGVRLFLWQNHREAVVLTQDTAAFVAPDEGEETAFKMGEGSVVLCVGRTRGSWVEVSLLDGSVRGWAQAGCIEAVDP